jgi:type III secretory pathway component EscV
VRGAGLESDDVHRAVCAVRLRLTPQLPGNTPEARRILLPQALEDELARWVWHADGKTFFAIPPQQTQNALNALRGLVEADDRSQVLVTRGAELRPFVRRLAEIEHPYLMVLAQEEVEGASSDEQP